MNKKIAIIGGGLFGSVIYILLKKNGFDCTLFEKNKDLLSGASTNNLNRVHLGYHYPRDDQTAKQSHKGYLSFNKFFKKAIVNNFQNYYFIANKSKVNFKKYLEFCKRNKLNFTTVNNFRFKLNNIEGGIKVKEPIYDWDLILKLTNSLIGKLKKNKVYLNEKVEIINKDKHFNLITNKNSYFFDIVIDASYDGSNNIIKNISKRKKRRYQLVVVFEFLPKNFNKIGLAVMDGDFFSFLPKGKGKKHLLYHVKHSVLKQKECKEFPSSWYRYQNFKSLTKKSEKLLLKDLKNHLPDLKIKLTGKKYISPRVLPNNVEKSDKRVSTINEISKNYYQIFSAKVDHSVDIAEQLLSKIKKN